MSLREAFLRDIIEHPEDSVPRLIFADWLEEHGDEADQARAEFIRTQCTLSELPLRDTKRTRLEGRELDLRTEWEVAWLAPLRERYADVLIRWDWRRGFLGFLGTEGVRIAANAGLFQETPIEQLRVFNGSGLIGEICKTQALRFITILELSLNTLSQKDVLALAESPFEGLQCVHANRCKLTHEKIRLLLGSSFLQKLETFSVSNNNIDASCMSTLFTGPYLQHLRILDIRNNPLRNGVNALISGTALQHMECLMLGNTELSDCNLLNLSRAPHAKKLRLLNLDGNNVGLESIRALLEAREALPSLELLSVNTHGPIHLTTTYPASLQRAIDARGKAFKLML